MAKFEPTSAQKAAIEESGRAVLVSAAAGSGKTRVLTERLLRRIENDADIDSFLVITFTKAAAAELKSRILDEISERLAADPDNRRLRRQSALCSKAQIGTIDSFCQSFLRENCHTAQLSPEFRVIEEDRAEAIKQRVIQRVLDDCYEAPDEGFKLLTDTVGMGRRDDNKLAETVLALHRKTQSHARPELWLQQQLETLEPAETDAGRTVWGSEILRNVRDDALYWAQRMDDVCRRAAEDEAVAAKYGPSFAETALSLRDFARACDLGWDRAREALPISYPRLGTITNPPDPELKEYTKAVRELCKKNCSKYEKLLSASSEKLLSDMHRTAPAMRALIELTLRFDRAFSAEKRRKAEVDFADLEHLTAQLLTNEDGSPTELARETSQRFCEIMVDEYQDVNRVQDDIFRALSKNGENLFMVGDVKQSIYRFRLADPLIFTDKYEKYSFLTDAGETEPIKIMLQENFRSRQEVIDGINSVFTACMSKKLGEIDYDENALLRCGGVYDDSGCAPELILIDVKGDEDDLRDKTEKEAAVVADKIRELMLSGMTVSGRALGYGDIALLMRSANSVGEVYRRELIVRGIPVAAGQGGSFFASTEIASLMSLLAIIDNPHQDVALIAVLRSSAFGFTADELTEMRLADREGDFYTALKKAAETNEKCAAFLETLGKLRSRAPDTPVDELLMFIYNELDLPALCAAMQDAPQRLANLRMMLELSKRFASGGFRGLHRFCQWLRRLAERGGDMGAASSEGAVKIMTIHKSKGLEFPVVFLCDASRRFNDADLKQTVLIHPELGLGAKVYDLERRLEYPGLARNAIKQRLKREMLSEEMRLLYVALTRARERLIVTAAMKEPEKKLQSMMLQCMRPMSPEVLLGAQSMADWMIYAQLCTEDDKFKLSFISAADAAAAQAEEPELEKAPSDAEIVEKLRRNLAFAYPHEAATHLPSKVTATELKHLLDESDEEAASLTPTARSRFRTPRLGDAYTLTPTQRGSAAHALLQHIDYSKTGSEEEIRGEITRMTREKFLTAQQAETVDTGCIRQLFASRIGQRIMNADRLRREFKFSLLCPAEKFFPGGEGESVLLQGVIDCMIEENGEVTIIDYKTDRVRGSELIERAKGYEKQLEAYAYAAQRMTGKPVRECVLYFLYSGETVELPAAKM
jgi:ATP-dependent helicase/nuclease subunit A